MIPPTHFAAPPSGEVSASPDTPPQRAGRDTFSQACARSLKSPVIVTTLCDGGFLVEPLHFHRVVVRGRAGRAVVAKNHDTANSLGEQHDHL